jgi:glucose/arabinose dehydrogenase
MVGVSGHRSRWSFAAGAILAAVAVGLALLGSRASGGTPTLSLRPVGAFNSPIYVTHAPGASGFLYVVEQAGTVQVVDHGTVRPQPFLDIGGRVDCCGERGLLSIAFDPRYASNHIFYADYTNAQGNLEVDEFHAPSNTSANRFSRRAVIVIPHPGESNHNGGQLQFGPDGDLYISTGDGGGGGDNHDNARHLNVLLGKILRINPHEHGSQPYTVPQSNPFVGRTGRDEIYSYGLRNPWRFSFDSANGNLAIGDVGQDAWEEIDYVTRQRAKGSYFGWPTYEGNVCFQSCDRTDPNPNARPPVFPIEVHDHNVDGYHAIIGGYVVHSSSLSLLNGRYVYSDNANGEIRSLVPHTTGATGDQATGLNVSSPSAFGVGAGGQLYVASLGDGNVYQVVQHP